MKPRTVVPLLLATAAGCSDLSFTTAVNRIPVAIANPSFAQDIAPLLDRTCAASGACHFGPNAREGLDLSLGRAYAEIVNVTPTTSFLAAPYRVRPGFPDSSFLYRVLSMDPVVRIGYTRMPLTPDPLPQPVVETIRNWIGNGAPNN
jgi:hypothetical protein